MRTAFTPQRAEGGLWLLIWTGLAVGTGVEMDWGRQLTWPLPAVVAPPAEFTRPALSEPFSLPPPDQLIGITERPIFIVTRRPPPVPPPAEPPKPSMKKDQFTLMGTTIVGEGKFAFLLEKSSNKTRVVAEGKEINGIMVKSVTADQVVLSQNDDTEVLVLKTSAAPAQSASTQPAATAPAPANVGTPGTRPITGRRPTAAPPTSGAPGQAAGSVQPGAAPPQ